MGLELPGATTCRAPRKGKAARRRAVTAGGERFLRTRVEVLDPFAPETESIHELFNYRS